MNCVKVGGELGGGKFAAGHIFVGADDLTPGFHPVAFDGDVLHAFGLLAFLFLVHRAL